MVCMGNICRSPLAEGILRHKINKKGIMGVEVDSAGMEYFHVGDSPDSRAIAMAKKHRIDISAHRARLFQKSDFEMYDKIYVMDAMNYRDVMYYAHNDSDRQKVDYLMNADKPGENLNVPDPWYGGMIDFERAFQLIDIACEKIVEKINA